jgi:hypothetical protein
MNKLLSVLLLLVMVGCTPVRYVMVDPKDSTKLVEVRKRIIYQDTYMDLQMPMYYWNRPLFYNPIIIPIPQRRVVTPQRPIRTQPNWYRTIPPRAPRNR